MYLNLLQLTTLGLDTKTYFKRWPEVLILGKKHSFILINLHMYLKHTASQQQTSCVRTKILFTKTLRCAYIEHVVLCMYTYIVHPT